MTSPTKLKTVNDTDIYIDEKGVFSATIGDKLVTRRKLADLEKLLAAEMHAIPAILVKNYEILSPEEVELTGIEPNGEYRGRNRSLYHSNYFYHPDPIVEADLNEICAQLSELHQQWRQTVKRLKPITRADVKPSPEITL